MNLRDRIRLGMDFHNKTAMEIGPLYRPFILKSECDVTYVDHADAETLRKKYQGDPSFDTNDIVEIDAVWGEQNLQDCLGGGKKVDYIIASHVIEHVPNLIGWLNELKSVLNSGGEIRLVIPDKRFTFDYARRLTELSDILDAHLRGARRPLPLYILDHVINVCRVDVGEAWKKTLNIESLERYHSVDMAIAVANDALKTNNYHDVHCWVFIPESFAGLMLQCANLGLLDLECTAFEDSLHNTLEFTVFLHPTNDRDAVVKSWDTMQRMIKKNHVPPRSEKNFQAIKDSLGQMSILSNKCERQIYEQGLLINNLHNLLAQTEQINAELSSLLSVSRAEVASYANSTSWKITKPLRKIMDLVRNYRLLN